MKKVSEKMGKEEVYRVNIFPEKKIEEESEEGMKVITSYSLRRIETKGLERKASEGRE